jgi:hypothetical protein
VSAVAVAAVATLVYSDFENLAEKRLLLTGVFSARVPEGFVAEHRQWLQLCLVTVLLGCVVAIVGERTPRERPFSRIRLNSLKGQVTAVLGGHIASGLVLLETALGTTGLLVHAHERGFIYVPIFQSILPNLGVLLKYAWLGPPIVALVVPLGFLILREAATWVLSLGQSRAKRDVPPPLVATSPTSHVRGVFAFRTSPSGVLAVALTLGGLCLTVGQMPRLGEQLSAKEALLQFSRLGKPGEPLALLGVGAQAARYYLSSSPKTFAEIGAAASWLAGGQANTRFMALAADELAPLNAAFRAQTSGRNLVLPASLRGRVLLAASRPIEGTTNHNPLASIVLAAQAHAGNVSSGEFGNAVRLEGWEFRELAGGVVGTLRRGERYRLRLVFRVLDPPLADWQIFVHLDGNGHRQNGDHEPSGGTYPTSLWQSGDIIVDDSTFALESSSPPGRQRLYLGFFRNTTRWDVTRGNHDDNRLMVGDVTVQ